MSLKKFLISRIFLINIIIAVSVTILIVAITLYGLRLYTNHGQSYPVPDLTGLSELEVKGTLATEKLNYRIIDSAYVSGKEPGSVIDQEPKPGFKVKENRTILLTINSSAPEQVKLPKLRDISYRQAQVLIENSGLFLGSVDFKPSEFDDLVLEAYTNEEEIFAGAEILKGTEINLVIGRSSGFEKTAIPNLSGLSLDEAHVAIIDALLNPGVIIYDETIKTSEDSVDARIWKQLPDPKITDRIELGTSIDMWVTVDEDKIIEAIDL